MTDITTAARELLAVAAKATPEPYKIARYDHGGARVYTDRAASRELIADFYNYDDREAWIAARAATLPGGLVEKMVEVVAATERMIQLRREYNARVEAEDYKWLEGEPGQAVWAERMKITERMEEIFKP